MTRGIAVYCPFYLLLMLHMVHSKLCFMACLVGIVLGPRMNHG